MSADGRCLFRVHASTVLVNPQGLILMVQEEKAASRGRWNLPGGHTDHGETPLAAAIRETLEETHILCSPISLLGIYTSHHALRFMYEVPNVTAEAKAGHEILAVRWFSPEEIMTMPDEQMVGPYMTRQILRDLAQPQRCPLHAARETDRPKG